MILRTDSAALPLDNICSVMIEWKISGKISRPAPCIYNSNAYSYGQTDELYIVAYGSWVYLVSGLFPSLSRVYH